MARQDGEEPSFVSEVIEEKSDGTTEITIDTNNPQRAAELLREQGVPEEFWPQNLKDDLNK